MTWNEFKRKWHRFTGKESPAYQEHFNDLCRLLGHPTPVEADPSGNDFFCFQKGVIKDAELLGLEGSEGRPPKKGFADVWKKDSFGWEYKGKHKNLDEAYRQLQRYREALLNPPLLVVCDFDRYIIRTNFNGTVRDEHAFTNDQIDRRENQTLLRYLFENPAYLKPQRTTAQVTETLAAQIAEVARSLQMRESVELADARSREEIEVAQKKNLRIARFLNRIIFCFFAEDTGLLPKNLFVEIAKTALDDLKFFAERLEELFRVMAQGGAFGHHKIRHFNGHLFEEATVFELTEAEIRKLAEAAESDWQFIEPSIMGTLFERAIDERHRAQLGAHYTSRTDIETLVEPVLMAPFRREWAQLKGGLASAYAKGRGTKEPREKLAKFLKKLSSVTVLDPACGSGNFLYVALQLLLGLEKDVLTFATQLGFRFEPRVSVQQLKAIEINPYAFELAQVSVQIGYLQWRRDNGYANDRSPVLQVLNGFENKDALLKQTFRKKSKSLKEARAEEHAGDATVKVYTERAWPECDVIVGNPPFLGGKLLRRELGDPYVDALFENFGKRVRREADLCCYWFEKARERIEEAKCKRAGLLATQGIRGGANRETLKHIKRTGDIFFAESDRNWVLDGAVVHVSMIGFDDGAEQLRKLNGQAIESIGPDLSDRPPVHQAHILSANQGLSFMGVTPAGPFDLLFSDAREWLTAPTPGGKANSDVLRPYYNGQDLNQRPRFVWTIDFGIDTSIQEAAGYEQPFGYLDRIVRPVREQNRREIYARRWWLYAEPRPAMREAFFGKSRYVATCMVAKHRIFVWLDSVCMPANVVIVFSRDDDYFFGTLNSRFHLVWADSQGTQLREKESGSRYTPTTCFETFPFPFPDDLQPPAPPAAPKPKPIEPDRTYAEMMAAHFYSAKEEPPKYGGDAKTPDEHRAAISAAAKELNELRERWLNPPEWTLERLLEFPGSVNGPWSRYIGPSTIKNSNPEIGLVRYPRLEPRDAECAARLKKRTLTNLYNERPTWLDLAHRKLDAAVAAAYGWPADISDEQILERLLALNLERAAAEAKTGQMKMPKAQRAKSEDELL